MWVADMNHVLQIFFQRAKTTATGIAILGKLLFHVSPYDIDDLIFGHRYFPEKPRHAYPFEQKINLKNSQPIQRQTDNR
jgi:hypothetical protein